MRFIGILLIIAGLFYTVAKPWFASSSNGEELARTTIFNKAKSNNENRGWQVASVFLDEKNSPLRVQMKVWRRAGPINDSGMLKLLVRVASIAQNGQTGKPDFNRPIIINLEDSSDSSQSTNDLEWVSQSGEAFEISNTGQYKIGAFPISSDNVTIGKPDLDIDPSIDSIELIVRGDAQASSTSSSLLGVAMVIFGIIMLSIFRRRKTAKSNSAPEREIESENEMVEDEVDPRISNSATPKVSPEPQPKAPDRQTPDRKTDVGKTIKWGRDAGKDR